MDAPRQVLKEQYAWDPECEGYVFAKFLTKQVPFFSDEQITLECPRGHAVLKGKEAEKFLEVNAKVLEADAESADDPPKDPNGAQEKRGKK